MQYNLSDSGCEVHLWKSNLNQAQEVFSDIEIFSDEEKERAGKFIHEEDRNRFMSAHSFMRKVLSKYTLQHPKEIQFAYGSNQKPFLKNRMAKHPLYFNLSYRANYALLALSNAENIGVDVEKIHDIDNICSFADNYFSAEEQQIIFSKSRVKEQLASLFTFWTMKEAVIKSLGIGFMMPFTVCNLSKFLTAPYGVPFFESRHKWYIKPVAISHDYKAALAIKAREVSLKVFDYAIS